MTMYDECWIDLYLYNKINNKTYIIYPYNILSLIVPIKTGDPIRILNVNGTRAPAPEPNGTSVPLRLYVADSHLGS